MTPDQYVGEYEYGSTTSPICNVAFTIVLPFNCFQASPMESHSRWPALEMDVTVLN